MNKMFRKTITLAITIAMLLSTSMPIFAGSDSMDHFQKTISYTPGQFKDVDENQWYGANNQQSVQLACELGLMKGNGDKFEPNGNVTLAQAITMAARSSAIYIGEDQQFVQGQPWYQVYVDYCIDNKIISTNDFFNYNEVATRAQMAYIFANALPNAEFDEINIVEALPDISEKSTYGKEVFSLYKAGIVGGNDSLGTFTPNSYIKRAASAAIIARLALPEKRLTGLSFVATIQEPEAEVEDYTQTPDYLWNYYYTSGTKLDSIGQLEWILLYATANLIPEFRVNVSSGIFSNLGAYIPDGIESLGWSYYSGAYYDTTITPQYNVYGEVKALLSSDMAWDYASTDAIDYYYTLQDMLGVIGTFGKSDQDKVTLIHNYIVKNYQYDTTYTRYSFSDFIDSGSAVCQGYAQMFLLLGRMAGLDVQYLTGLGISDGTSKDHAWNRVLVDGYWYYVDTTWDDPIPDRGDNGSIRKDYLLITRTKMDKDHILQEIDGLAVE